jgi:HK97 family phage major capsid protein
MSDENMGELIKTELQRIGSESKLKIDELRSELREAEQKFLGLAPGNYSGGGGGADFARIVSQHAGIKELSDGATKNTVTIPLQISAKQLMMQKAAITSLTFAPESQTLPGLGNLPTRPLRLLDILPVVQMTHGSAQYVRLTGAFANAAAYQLLEGDVKAEGIFPTELITTQAATIAVTLPVSSQILADAPALEQQLGALLMFCLYDRLERELIAGSGIGNRIAGLSSAATAFAPTAGLSSADKIGEAGAALATAGWIPNGVILSAADFFKIASAHGVDGRYIADGGWAMPPRPNIWGLDVVVSAGAIAGTALVFDTQQLGFLDRMQATVDVGYVADQFARNLLTLRAELRAQLAIYSPASVLSVALA